jgi:hypothetical protein
MPDGYVTSAQASFEAVSAEREPCPVRRGLESFGLRFHLGRERLESKCSAAASKNVFSVDAYNLFTKTAQSSGPENIGPERPLPGHLPAGSVLSPPRITLENNEKIRPQPDRENSFS